MQAEPLEDLPPDLRDAAEDILFLLSDNPYHEERVVLSMINSYCGGDIAEIQRVATAALVIHFANPNRKA